MPFAPKIRTDILLALEERIIPALRKRRFTQVLAEPPFDFGNVEHRVLQKKFLEDKEFAPFQTIMGWNRQSLNAMRFTRFAIIFSGTCIDHIGITQGMAQQLTPAQRASLGGITELTLRAPTLICRSPFTPSASGTSPHQSFIDHSYAVTMAIMNSVRISIVKQCDEGRDASHNLEINDSALVQMAHLYAGELRAGEKEGAQSLFLAFALRLRQYLQSHRAFISNSCWVTPPDIVPEAAKVLSPANLQLCQNLIEYIIGHLHAPLTLASLAAYFHVSDVHLNTIFKQAQSTTVMNFVTQMRIEAAKTIIAKTPERINDVAQLVGFKSDTGFTNTFRRITGMSPREYRTKIRATDKSTFNASRDAG